MINLLLHDPQAFMVKWVFGKKVNNKKGKILNEYSSIKAKR